jgi:hypothetical protein
MHSMRRLNLHLTLLADDLLHLNAFLAPRGSRGINLTASTALTSTRPCSGANRLRGTGQIIQQSVLIVPASILGARPWHAEPSSRGNFAAAAVLGARSGAGALFELGVDIGVRR